MIKRVLSGISVSFQHKDTIPSMIRTIPTIVYHACVV